MFVPKIYRSEDKTLMKKIINENSFALLISGKEKIFASHSVFVLNETEDDQFFLETHITKTNFQTKVLKNGDEVLCDFLGAHSYVSSSWYNHTNASTWNYEAVQVRGKVEIMKDEELFAHLEKLTHKYEQHQRCPMMVDKMGKEFVENTMKGALGIRIWPTELYLARKLSQNRNEEDFQNIIKELEKSPVENSRKIAELMNNLKK